MSWTITGAEKTPVDPYFSNVSLLLHGDGTNGSTTIVDSSPTPKTVTAVGDAQISTAVADPFGNSTGVLAFDGTDDRLLLPQPVPEDLRLGNVDFTIEFWIYTLGTGTYSIVGNLNNHIGAGHYWVILNSTIGGLHTVQFGAAGSNIGSTQVGRFGSNALTVSTWHHIALARSGTSLNCYMNGLQLGTTQTLNNFTGFGVSGGNAYTVPYYIGASQFVNNDSTSGSVTYQLNGYIDDLRITKGVARYTSNFTPPTAPFPDA